MDKKACARWLRRQFFVPRPEGPCVRLEVSHHGAIKKGSTILVFNFEPNEQIDDSAVERIADEIDTGSQDDADGLDGIQTYVIHSFFQLQGDRPLARFPFRQQAESAEESEPTEPATTQGLVHQLMRQNEQLHRNQAGVISSLFSTMQKNNAQLSQMVENLTTQKFRMLDDYEQMATAKDERARTVRIEEAKEKRLEGIFETFLPLVPAAINYMAGQKLLPEKTTPERMAVTKFFETVTPEQFQKLRTSLDMEQFGIIVTIVSDIKEGIDSNLPGLFRRFMMSLRPEQVPQLQDVFSMPQQLAIKTIMESFAAADRARAQAEASKAPEPPPPPANEPKAA